MSQAGHKWLAALTSILLHLLVLSFLGLVGFNYETRPTQCENLRQTRIEYVKNLIHNQPVLDNLKFKNSFSKHLTAESIDCSKKIRPAKKTKNIRPLKIERFDTNNNFDQQKICFFSSESDSRRICFLVDCSGSMQGLWGTVKTELIRSIDSLLADQYFSIVFFGDNGILQFTNGKLIRASKNNKKKAITFIGSVKPGGQTNTLAGFEAAVKLRDAYSNGPDVIFFLTDGFELMGSDTGMFELTILKLIKENLPRVKINTMSFWPSAEDIRMLKGIANRSRGEFINIMENSYER